jgi:hypothetical protein
MKAQIFKDLEKLNTYRVEKDLQIVEIIRIIHHCSKKLINRIFFINLKNTSENKIIMIEIQINLKFCETIIKIIIKKSL